MPAALEHGARNRRPPSGLRRATCCFAPRTTTARSTSSARWSSCIVRARCRMRPTPTALFLLAESYFKTKQYLSARRHYREIVERRAEARTTRTPARSLSRLVDVALRNQRPRQPRLRLRAPEQLAGVRRDRLARSTRAARRYLRASETSAPRRARSTPCRPDSEYSHQAQYLLGVILVKEATPAPAAAPEAPPLPPDSRQRRRHAAPSGRRRRRERVTRPRSSNSARSRACPRDTDGAPARHRPRLDGDRPAVLRDRQLPRRGRGLQPRRPHLARVLDDALRARLGLRAARRLPARPARARGADDHRSRSASSSPTARCCAPI